MTPTIRLASITVYPIKSLDGLHVTQARIAEGGALQHDRAWALFGDDGKWLRAKTTPALHHLRTGFDADCTQVTITDQRDGRDGTFSLTSDLAPLEAFLSRSLAQPIHVKHRTSGYPDGRELAGPTVTSVGTLRAVASWYDGLTEDDIHRRMRSNLVLDASQPFFEDRLIRGVDHVCAFSIGDVTLEGVTPVDRCAVPVRDPVTAAKFPDFQHVFMRQRDATFPADVVRDRFEHLFYLTIRTRASAAEVGKTLAVGDVFETVGEREI